MNIDVKICTDLICKHRFKATALVIMSLIGWPLYGLIYNEIQRSSLDPKIPYQIYRPPPAPNYNLPQSWFLNPALSHYYADPRRVDVFFLHGTAYNGGSEWLSPVQNQAALAHVVDVQLPNYAGPFAMVGNVYAPKYRHASLYAHLNMREDSIEARRSAYQDAEDAFDAFIKLRKGGNGFIIVGLEQGGFLVERLLRDRLTNNAHLRSQLVATYLIDTLLPQKTLNDIGLPVCTGSSQFGCVIAYNQIDPTRPDQAFEQRRRALYWKTDSEVETVGSEPIVCVNPLSGRASEDEVSLHNAKGATNATGLEWGAEPALMPRKVSAYCKGGNLIVSMAHMAAFKTNMNWTDRQKVEKYNLFYGDLQEDSHKRWTAYLGKQ